MRKYGKTLGCVVLSALMGISFCTDNDKPDSIYGPETVRQDPVITSVSPENRAFSGVTEMTIQGENFLPEADKNFIYFGAAKGEVVSATENELTVIPPVIEQDDLTIKLAVSGAYQFASFSPYQLEYAASKFSDFGSFDNIMTMAMDKDENLYVHKGNKEIERVSPDGTREIIGSASIPVTTSMKVGPGGNLFMVRKNKYIYRYDIAAGDDDKFVKVDARLIDFDFDANGIIYGGGKGDGITVIQADGSSFTETADYEDYDISTVRVFDGYVYVAAVYGGRDEVDVESGIWRSQIKSADGTLGEKELYFNWGEYAAESGAEMLDVEIDESGSLYVGCDKGYAVVRIDENKVAAPFYERVLFPSSEVMCWGNSNRIYIYRNCDTAEEIKVVQVKTPYEGAPYYGRGL